MMKLAIMSICCLIYYALSAIQMIPSIYRILKRKSSIDYSVIATWISMVALICWSIYIYLSEQTILVYVGTTIDLVMLIVYTISVLYYHNDK